MHNNSYTPKVACCSGKNFINSMQEIKSFFSFELIFIEGNFKHLLENNYDAIIIESDVEKKISLEGINIPKIFIQEKNFKKTSKNPFELIIKLPLNVVKFNQSVVDLCKKYEFNANSQIKIKDYILDKNERILKKNNKNLKITEKEINFIETLNSNKEPLTKDYILKNIWGYSSSTDTHTIETHIYRLRQKIKDSFDDENFIKNTKSGYSL